MKQETVQSCEQTVRKFEEQINKLTHVEMHTGTRAGVLICARLLIWMAYMQIEMLASVQSTELYLQTKHLQDEKNVH